MVGHRQAPHAGDDPGGRSATIRGKVQEVREATGRIGTAIQAEMVQASKRMGFWTAQLRDLVLPQ